MPSDNVKELLPHSKFRIAFLILSTIPAVFAVWGLIWIHRQLVDFGATAQGFTLYYLTIFLLVLMVVMIVWGTHTRAPMYKGFYVGHMHEKTKAARGPIRVPKHLQSQKFR
jgi:ABC-type multidrug transport system fused ATPase/permease subunit